MRTCAIGIDFGTESVRSILVDVATGETVATAVHQYADGVIDAQLPAGAAAGATAGAGAKPVTLGPDWALQNPADWLTGLTGTVRGVLAESGLPADAIIGLGIDFTSCTILPTTKGGVPLCELAPFRAQPHAWPKLWKHHAAQPQADRVTALAEARGERWLPRYGGRISSEWLLPKALQIAEEAPLTYDAADVVLEGADWVVWQLTGRLVRNACGAGYKGNWHKQEGYPSVEFRRALNPRMADFYETKVAGDVRAPGVRAGGLTEDWAARLGLAAGTPVAVPIIDAHAAVLGSGVAEPGPFVMMMGTSTCQLLMSDREEPVIGMTGVVEDGILPGLFAYEAGQAAVGDIFAWFVQHGVPESEQAEARARGVALHQLLEEKAAAQRPGEHGLLALDWWNGNRSTLGDADLSGLLVGLTLATRPADIYRALLESTAYGARVILEAFTARQLAITRVVAGGGLTKNALVMQIYADVLNRAVEVAGAPQASALGAAMLGAVAAGAATGGYDMLSAAASRMAPAPVRVFTPIPANVEIYERLFRLYADLYDHFGRRSRVMKELRHLRA
jgi:L-ribulokinase